MTSNITKSVLLVFHSAGDRKLSIDNLPPLGILSIASYLENKGIQCDVLDLTVNPKDKIEPINYDIIGFSINISNRQISLKTIDEIKREFPAKHIIAGGSLCISNPEYFLSNPNIEAIFVGEGEEALYEYLTFDNKEKVKGIYWKKDTDYIYTGKRKWIENLDALPFPALNKVDIKKYNCYPKRKLPISSIMTSRGCPFNCIFCSHSMGKKWRYRSASNVVNEIKWQVYELGVKEICIFDDNFSLDKRRAEMICNQLIEEKVPITLQFTNGLRVDCLDYNLLYKLKEAGTWLIGLAPESGNPQVLKKIKKGFNHTQIMHVRKKCKKLGIKTFGFFMIGFPFETKTDIEDTIKYSIELDCEVVEFNKVVPYSKTELYDIIVKSGYQTDNNPLCVQSYHEGTINTHKVGDLEPEDLKDLIRIAYRSFYLRPRKMVDLLRTFSLRDLFELTYYALRTKNI